MKPFALYHCYSDGSSPPDVIYVGSDKAAAFDALFAYAKSRYFDSCSIHIAEDPAPPKVTRLTDMLPEFTKKEMQRGVNEGRSESFASVGVRVPQPPLFSSFGDFKCYD